LGARAQGLRDKGPEFEVQEFGCRVLGEGLGVSGFRFRDKVLGARTCGQGLWRHTGV